MAQVRTGEPLRPHAPSGGGEGARDLVLVPGLNNSAGVWDDVVSHLPSHLAARAVDCPPLDDIDAIAAALLEELPDRFVAVGHSFGGYVVVAMLALAPERLEAVALVCSGGYADTPAQAQARLTTAEAARTGDYIAMATARADLLYHPDNADDAVLAAKRRRGVEEYGVERYVAHLAACASRPDREQLLLDTDVPLLLVAADGDQVVPPGPRREAAARAGAAFALVPGAGHMLPAEQPAALAGELAAWLAATPASRPSLHEETA